jgi:hypothetical protein
VFAPAHEDGRDARVLGGSAKPWPAERREALDWLTLCRFLGWEARLERESVDGVLADGTRLAILACPPESIDADSAAAIEARLASQPTLVIAPAAAAGTALARLAGVSAGEARRSFGAPRWVGEDPHAWTSRLEVEARSVVLDTGSRVWAFVGGAPLVVGRSVGRGAIATMTAHPSKLRDAGPSGTGVLRHLATRATPGPLAWLDLERTVVLRMDDPGAAINAYLRSWSHRELGEEDWRSIGSELAARDARMSACYVPGWVDDGDAERGELLVASKPTPRAPGAIHPSPLVRYRALGDAGDEEVHDYEAECRGLAALREAGCGDVEQHGYTHVRPEYERWAAAPDRYENVYWYRELEGFGESGDEGIDPIASGKALLGEHLGVTPTTLTCPGQACTDAAAELALDAGFELVATDAIGIRDGDRLHWSCHLPAAGLDYPVDWLFEAGLPVIASLHDRDIALNGPGWIGRWLDEWRAAGARRFIDFRELAGLLGVRVRIGENGEAEVSRRSPVEPLRDVPIASPARG